MANYQGVSTEELQLQLEEARQYRTNWKNLFLQGELDGETPERIKYYNDKAESYAVEVTAIENELKMRVQGEILASA
ncbi:hypothetical protein D0469_11060 [Peribacillus saganii]|uniref:Uncharacterized protein n=1 Tax=Peribacillus saganii TaxID=2303992 RepID=A0A372LP70_9BACI|nr:hypothetical protein [Peribacillus saganii]RFU69012.1 hypothetical protein D0469_11060 [Peribacillus saganii]